MKLNFFEGIKTKEGKYINPEQDRFEIAQAAQMELIGRAGGGEIPEQVVEHWVTANGKRFRELVENPKSNFIERLANEENREEALRELQNKLYH